MDSLFLWVLSFVGGVFKSGHWMKAGLRGVATVLFL